jgi:hypothetical protein
MFSTNPKLKHIEFRPPDQSCTYWPFNELAGGWYPEQDRPGDPLKGWPDLSPEERMLLCPVRWTAHSSIEMIDFLLKVISGLNRRTLDRLQEIEISVAYASHPLEFTLY